MFVVVDFRVRVTETEIEQKMNPFRAASMTTSAGVKK